MVAALEDLDAYAFGDPRRLRFSFEHLNNHGRHLTETKAGRIDALGAIGKDGNVVFEDLLSDCVRLSVFGAEILCISLEQLIRMKRELGRPRDLAAVLELGAIRKSESEG